MAGHLVLADGSVWPDPADPNEDEWQLRYGADHASRRMAAASYMAAYRALVTMPERQRNAKIRMLRDHRTGETP